MSATVPRVLIDLSVDPAGGAATYVDGFVEGLITGDVPNRDANVVLVSTDWADAHSERVGALRAVGVTVDPVSVPAPGTWRARMTRRRLIKTALQRRDCAVAFVPRDVAPRIAVPYVVLARNLYAWQKYSSYTAVGGRLSATLLRLAAQRSARGATKVLAVSHALARSMPGHLEIGVVHHGCSMTEFDRPATRLDGANPLIVAMIANVIPSKRIEVVIEGVAAAVAGGRATELRVYGRKADPDYCDRLDQQAIAALGGSVFRGPAFGSDLIQAYRDAHVLAVGGSFETFCLPLVEGMRAGCVIVAPKDALVEEICGDVAVTYDEGAPASFARALETAAKERAERSQAGIERARAFSWARTVEQTMEYIRAALDEPDRVRR